MTRFDYLSSTAALDDLRAALPLRNADLYGRAHLHQARRSELRALVRGIRSTRQALASMTSTTHTAAELMHALQTAAATADGQGKRVFIHEDAHGTRSRYVLNNDRAALLQFCSRVKTAAAAFDGRQVRRSSSKPRAPAGNGPASLVRDLVADGLHAEALQILDASKTGGAYFGRTGQLSDATMAPILYTIADEVEHDGEHWTIGRRVKDGQVVTLHTRTGLAASGNWHISNTATAHRAHLAQLYADDTENGYPAQVRRTAQQRPDFCQAAARAAFLAVEGQPAEQWAHLAATAYREHTASHAAAAPDLDEAPSTDEAAAAASVAAAVAIATAASTAAQQIPQTAPAALAAAAETLRRLSNTAAPCNSRAQTITQAAAGIEASRPGLAAALQRFAEHGQALERTEARRALAMLAAAPPTASTAAQQIQPATVGQAVAMANTTTSTTTSTGGHPPTTGRTTTAAPCPPPAAVAAQLEHGTDYSGAHPLDGWHASEKFDGVRAYWTGAELCSRSGKPCPLPSTWRALLPAGVPLDCELYAGPGGQAQAAAAIKTGRGLADMRLMVFDAPGMQGDWPARLAAARMLLDDRTSSTDPAAGPLQVVDAWPVASTAAAVDLMRQVVARGGEGLMLRRPGHRYRPGRDPGGRLAALVKLKPDPLGLDHGHT